MRLALLPLFLSLFLALTSKAQTTWTGTSDSNWSTAANWTAGVPTSTTAAVLPPGAPTYPIITGTVACLHLDIQSGSTLTIPTGATLEVSGNVNNFGLLFGNGLVSFIGSGLVDLSIGNSLPNVVVNTTGTYTFNSPYITGSFTLLNGTVRFDGPGSNITGLASFLGGTLLGGLLNLSPIFLLDDAVFSNCSVTTNPAFRAQRSLTLDAMFQPTGGAIVFESANPHTFTPNGATLFVFGILPGANVDIVGGPGRFTFGFLSFGSLTPTSVIEATGVAPTIPPQGSVPIPNLIVTSTNPCTIDGDVEITGTLTVLSGGLHLLLATTLKINGIVSLQNGQLLADDPFSGVLNCESDVIIANAVAGASPPSFNVAGNWTSGPSFQQGSGFIVFDGITPFHTATIAGSTFNWFASVGGQVVDVVGTLSTGGFTLIGNTFTPTSTVRFFGSGQITPSLGLPVTQMLPNTIVSGSLALDFNTIVGGTLLVEGGASLNIGDNDLTVLGSTATVDGTLSIGASGSLTLGTTTAATISATGTLNLIGASGNPATVKGNLGGGYSFDILGNLAATQFLCRDMGPAGIHIASTCVIAAPPNDFSFGTFDFGSSAANSVLLTLDRSLTQTFTNLVFQNTGMTTAFNVRTQGLAGITFVNWSGGFAGTPFEDDPANLITWAQLQGATLAGISATPGLLQVSFSFTTSSENNVSQFILEVGPSPSGPFAPLTTFVPVGPSTYTYQHVSLTGNNTYYYRLSEAIVMGPVQTLGAASACPWSAATPPTVLLVGPSGFATIQAAINTVVTASPAIISVAPGNYLGFTITDLPTTDINIRVFGDGTGPVMITSKITIQGPMNYFDRIELSDLTITGDLGNPGIEINNADASVIILDELFVTGATGFPGIAINDTEHVAIQRSTMTGTPGLNVTGVSVITVSLSNANSVTLNDLGSSLRRCQFTTTVNALPGSSDVEFPGIMPDCITPEFVQLGQPFVAQFSGTQNYDYVVLVSQAPDWLDLAPPTWEMVGLILIMDPVSQIVALGNFGPTGTAMLPLSFPPQKFLLGLPVTMQLVSTDALFAPTAPYRFSTVSTVVPMP